MSTPKHYSPTKSNRTAYKPYNFVSLPEKVVLAEALPDRPGFLLDRETGRIHCELTTLAPVYTRTALAPEFYDQWKDNIRELMRNEVARETYSQFFHLENSEIPLIPGSGLRGMVRNLVEVISYGKMQWVTPEPLVFRAVADMSSLGDWYHERMTKANIRAGYIEHDRDHWKIRPALPIQGKPFGRIYKDDSEELRHQHWENCKNAWQIFAYMEEEEGESLPVAVEFDFEPGVYQPYVMVMGGNRPPPRKDKPVEEKYFVLGMPDINADPILIPDEMVREYKEQLTPRQKEITGRGRNKSESGILDEGRWHPVFYLIEDGQLQFFGHTMMFRLPYRQSPLDMVPVALRDPDQTDLAEAIFGFVADQRKGKGRGSRAGRVFFTDAIMTSAPPDGPYAADVGFAPKILSGPKPTSFQLYLTQSHPDDPDQLNHYASAEGKTTLRGHKFYWRRGQVGSDEIKEPAQVPWANDTQHTSIRPVQAGVKFSFDIHFENLTEVELGALLWALFLPGAEQVCHSIGMGKPLGMGAVQLSPTLYLQNRKTRYETLFTGSDWEKGEEGPYTAEKFMRLFEDYVIQEGDLPKEREFRGQDRIRELLALLSWPGPTTGTNEPVFGDQAGRRMYVERRVLPAPRVVSGAENPALPPKDQIKPIKEDLNIPEVRDPSRAAVELFRQLSGSAKPRPDEGERVEVEVYDDSESTIISCLLDGYPEEEMMGFILRSDLGEKSGEVGSKFTCIVVEVKHGGKDIRLKPV